MSANPRLIRSSNRESQGLQYAMRNRLTQLGWSQIEVIDEDLGCSAAGGTVRAGFERMVAEVCLGKVGAVAAREVSRFARNSRDWQQRRAPCGWRRSGATSRPRTHLPMGHGSSAGLLSMIPTPEPSLCRSGSAPNTPQYQTRRSKASSPQ
jgi:Resolvase, N terminal domain